MSPKGLQDKPSRLTVASKYTALNGIGYLVVGAILIVWPGNPDALQGTRLHRA
jgi:hypothetical protein